jgi:ABC-type antimicrobial peptide transport system permease subunit
MEIQNKKILALILFVFVSITCNAQDFGGGGGMPQPLPAGAPPPPGMPIDEGLIVLFIIAVIYGIYISFKILKKKTQV